MRRRHLSLVILGLVPRICGGRAERASICDGCGQRIRASVCQTRVQILATRARMTVHPRRLSGKERGAKKPMVR